MPIERRWKLSAARMAKRSFRRVSEGQDGNGVRHQFCCPDIATQLSIFVLPLPLGEGRGEGAFVERSAAEGTLTRPTAGLSQRERQER